ncbi:MAG: hypothetical protein WB626_12530 [Bacteroidota bacterium]
MPTRTGFVLACLLALAALPAAGQEDTSGGRTSVDLTIYNQDLCLVREERRIRLARGLSRLVVPDIPATIDGTSMHFRSLTEPTGVRVLEQSYQYDLVHQAKLLEKYLGRRVEFVRMNEETKREYSVFGRLLATGYAHSGDGWSAGSYSPTGGLVAEIDGKVELNPAGRLVLPALPGGLILKPQLDWLVSSSREGEHRAEISYLAGGLSWNCTYVALLDKSDTQLDLTGWVTVTNGCGTTFADAGLKLVAGDVHVVRERMAKGRMGVAMEMQDAGVPQFQQTDLFEFKLYSLQRRITLADRETRQVELASARNVRARKVLIYDGLADQWRYWTHNASYRSQGSFGQQSNPKVGVFVTFVNAEKGGLGLPLPAGKVRVYKRDEEGKEQFIGEDAIDHTPKDEEVRLYLGNAFDVVGERVQKDFRSLAAGRMVEETIQIKVRNHKAEGVEVMVYEHPWRWSTWEILSASGTWEKVDQTTLRFPLSIPREGEGVVTYTIRYSW